MLKKCTLLLILLIGFSFQKTKAQQVIDSVSTKRAQNVYVELLGQGFLLTANYDTRFSNKRNGIGGRVGVGFGTLPLSNNTVFTIPIGLNYLIGKKINFFEVGLGATYLKSTNGYGNAVFNGSNDSEVVGTMSFSYRLQPLKSGLCFRIGLTPIFDKENFAPLFGGLSLGYTFSGK